MGGSYWRERKKQEIPRSAAAAENTPKNSIHGALEAPKRRDRIPAVREQQRYIAEKNWLRQAKCRPRAWPGMRSPIHEIQKGPVRLVLKVAAA